MTPLVTLEERAYAVRTLILEIALGAGTCHIASSLSIADIVAALYFDVLRDPGGRPDGTAGDRFVLSKGHGGSALLAALALTGTLEVDEVVASYCRDGSRLPGLAERGVPGVEVSGGSLGHGLAIAVGAALADRLDGSDRRTYCLLGDGELQEGSVWEAAALAGQLRLDALCAVVDLNGLQALGACDDIVTSGPLVERLATFGWRAIEVDGHDLDELSGRLAERGDGRPTAVVAHTVKGQGVDFMEGDYLWHYGSLRPEDRRRVFAALERGRHAERRAA